MASVAACIRESKCTASRIHQHIEKNSVPLKEVLTRRCQRARNALDDDATRVVRSDANSARKLYVANCQYSRKCLCRRCFRYSRRARAASRAPRATRFHQAKACRADSESRILAMKKFSHTTPSRRIGVRENRIFARIAQRRFA